MSWCMVIELYVDRKRCREFPRTGVDNNAAEEKKKQVCSSFYIIFTGSLLMFCAYFVIIKSSLPAQPASVGSFRQARNVC